MLALHRRLARIGLDATADYGFVLAGGYAIAANGIGSRPSEDVDLFTNIRDPQRFAEAAAQLRSALAGAGFEVADQRVRPTFVDLLVTDPTSGEVAALQLGLDFRRFPPTVLDVGPVLDLRDAVAGKMSALWSRGEARDYIDVDAVVQSGRFTRTELVTIGDQTESQPIDKAMLSRRFREAARHDVSVYAGYDVDPARRAQIIDRFAAWATEVDPTTATQI